MTFRRLRPSRRVSAAILTSLLLLVVGCSDEPISNYKAPHPDGQKQEIAIPPKPEQPPMMAKGGGIQRILGAIIVAPETTYFVKLGGSIETLEKFVGQFDQLLASLKFTGKSESPLTWTTPEGWKPGKGNQFSLAAFALPVEGRPLELTISPAQGSLLDNLNRWRGQVGLDPVADPAASSTAMAIDGKKAYRVDLKGEAKAAPPPPVAPKTPDAAPKDGPSTRILGAVVPLEGTTIYIKAMGPADVIEKNEASFDRFLASLKFTGQEPPLSWTVPEGWKAGRGTGVSFAAFDLPSDSGKPVQVALSTVGGPLLDNLNRWRQQVNLPPVAASKITDTATEIQIDGKKAYRVNLKGTGGASGMMTPPFMKK